MGDAVTSVLALPDLREPLIGRKRVAAGRDEINHGVEIGAREPRIGRSRPYLGIELVGVERRAARRAEHMLGEHVERAGAQRRGVLGILGHGVDRHATFQHLEPVGRHQHRA